MHTERVRARASAAAQDRLVELLAHPAGRKKTNPIDVILGNVPKPPDISPEESAKLSGKKSELREALLRGELERQIVEVEVEESMPRGELPGTDMNMNDMLGSIMPKKTKLRKVEVAQARRILEAEEAQSLIDMDAVYAEAIERAEQHGIVFLDEIDKIAGRSSGQGPDVSREGVQRDILPIVEGSTVHTKYGAVRTDHILFIAAGAFHIAKVGDLIPELQGRFPVHVTLKPLNVEDYRRILTQPENALIRQYQALLKVDRVELAFDESAIDAIARYAWLSNENSENIGARRLHTVLETILSDVAFNAGDGDAPEVVVTIDRQYVERALGAEAKEKDVRKYIL
jgi:ATP-dependent HslUV protease ATP-binding subunit HslU